ncbi:hypothetical protein SKAU_G00110140 [Synaphobranchus kaupii]|uniref:Uncharacterized protein n=1 Tax=Synaphobranchus kaupii TaxID=118154 RepID=A0A9Q1G1D8_SYNKA|nr:hypothetical protein SKAU_G00110140 [Synaphobranchus kaupii]
MEMGLAITIALSSITALVVKTRNHQATERRDNDTIEKLKQELNACEESASEARICYEELKESSNQQIEAVQNAQEYMDSESLRYSSIVQAFEEELAALMDIRERKEKMLVTMAEEGEKREEELLEMAVWKLTDMSAKCEQKEEELTTMACQLADMSQLCQSTEEKMAKLNKAIVTNLVEERLVGQERLESLETMTQLFNNKEEELAAMASRLEMSEKQLAAMSELCQAKDEQLKDMTQLHEATMNNLVVERQLGQERLKSLETLTQLLWNNAKELEDSRLDASEEKLEAMAQFCQSQDKRLEDAAELRGMLEMVLRQKIKREESQQLAMEQVEEGFQRRMLDSQRALEEERAEAASLRKKLADVVCQLADLQKPPSPTPTPGCSSAQETLPVEDEKVLPALDRDEHGKEIQKSKKQADTQEQVLAQQESGQRRRKEKPRWAKMVYGNYQPNRWFTEEQIINKRPSSQTQMSSDQRGRGSDARRPGAQGMGRRDQGAAGHQRPRPREIEWAQHWRAEYNPYRTVKGAF